MMLNQALPKKSVCIFDFDGTLVDSMGAFADLAAQLIAGHYGVPSLQAREDYLRTSGLPFVEQLEFLFPNHPSNREVASRFEEEKREEYLERPFFHEVPQTLAQLKEHGIRSVVSSNNGQEIVEEFLENQPVPKPDFDLVLGFREGFGKGPAHFAKILAHFNLPIHEALFVGDSLQDAKKARSFGLDFVGRLGTFSRREFQEVFPQVPLVEDLSELLEVVCR
jgi:phosphoglycolate phosphatase-like HAD superfamily hydrolase